MQKQLSRPLAILALFALAACGGGGGNGGSIPNTPTQPTGLTGVIVGVGDSLTAGYQAGGLLGAFPVTNPVSALPGGLVPPTQENGFWGLLYAQAKGLPTSALGGPNSPLPLINGPGLGDQLVFAAAPPFFAPTHSSCDAFNQAAFSQSGLSTVRINQSSAVYDVAVPGQTAHEALYQINPITGPPNGPGCSFTPNPNDPTAGGLQSLIAGESGLFLPILGGFANQSSPPNPFTQVNAAVSLHPTLATVWLGANDLLKYTFSGGNPAASDSPGQMQADITLAIQKLQGSGAKVVVANLPDILGLPQFFAQPALPQTIATFTGGQVPAAAVQGLVLPYLQSAYGIGAGGYLTETGFFGLLGNIGPVITALSHGQTPPPFLDPNGKGSGLGGAYLTDQLAAQVQGLNTAYNASIGAAATATGAPLVDIHSLFVQIKTAGGVPINPPKCCSLQFGGGILSFDGLHPSNTGYALIANAFIDTINAKLGGSIPDVNVGAIYSGAASFQNIPDPYAQH
ncbi:MAG: SGNH/GDSL hydrolase family protein [Candidatus Eremiobacteraeota bacterium]|nr:SGNH/GDSL hydrolase family protein [Candidatus Eremiobacteraeota bacterium]